MNRDSGTCGTIAKDWCDLDESPENYGEQKIQNNNPPPKKPKKQSQKNIYCMTVYIIFLKLNKIHICSI